MKWTIAVSFALTNRTIFTNKTVSHKYEQDTKMTHKLYGIDDIDRNMNQIVNLLICECGFVNI